MKFFIALLVSVITAVKAMALDPLGSPLAARDDHSVTTTYPNGTTKVELFSGGVYVGAAIEDGDSGAFSCFRLVLAPSQPPPSN
jgi:hypothetical protein